MGLLREARVLLRSRRLFSNWLSLGVRYWLILIICIYKNDWYCE
ncbi:hypothetical protein [Caldivirga maquilingensis]|nr:hypothetical protein [Caldivirga maquilingensis]